MYIVSFENAEENYAGPFEKITLDAVNDSGFIFLCSDPDNGDSRCCVSGTFEIVENSYLEV